MNIFGIEINPLTERALKRMLEDGLSGDKKIFFAKSNSEFLVRASQDRGIADLINTSDYNIADGKGVQWAAKYLSIPISGNHAIRIFQSLYQMIYSGAAIVFCPSFINKPIPKTFPGVEALSLMIGRAEKTGSGVFFFGNTDRVLVGAANNIRSQFPMLKVAGSLNGYDFQNDKDIDPVEIINNSGAKLLIVSLGSPKQEYWIRDNISKLKGVRIAVGEGGTLDRIANPSQKAPKWLNRIGLEWLWRLFLNKSLTDGRSRFQRFWNSVPRFIYEVVKYKIHNGASELEV